MEKLMVIQNNNQKWIVEYLDRNTLALKNKEENRYLSAQPGILSLSQYLSYYTNKMLQQMEV